MLGSGEKEYFSELNEEQRYLWHQLTHVQRKLIIDAYQEEDTCQALGFSTRQRKPISYQVLIELVRYCRETGCRMNDRRWRLVPKYRIEKTNIRTLGSILSEIKMIIQGKPEKRRMPVSIDVVEDKTGDIIVRLKRRGTVKEYNRQEEIWEIFKEEKIKGNLAGYIKPDDG